MPDHDLGRASGEPKGRYEQQRIWLWLVIAHLWAGRLIAAAKHGLPYRRVEIAHYGRALRTPAHANLKVYEFRICCSEILIIASTRVATGFTEGPLRITPHSIEKSRDQRVIFADPM